MGIGAISFWREREGERRNKAEKRRRKFVERGNQIRHRMNPAAVVKPLSAKTHTSSSVRPSVAMKCRKRVRQKAASRKGGKGRRRRQRREAFLFYIHEISCPSLYFIASAEPDRSLAPQGGLKSCSSWRRRGKREGKDSMIDRNGRPERPIITFQCSSGSSKHAVVALWTRLP